jgi:hypothetical protein
MSYRVRAADPADVADELCALWSRNLGASCHDPQRRLAWFYLENPAGRGIVHLLECEADSVPVGCMGIGMRRYDCAGRTTLAALFGDLAVGQKHRSLGPALTLQRATRSYAQDHFPLSLGYPNDKALPSLLRLGFRELGRMLRYAVPLRYREYIERSLPKPPAGLAAVVVDSATALRAMPGYLSSRLRFRLEKLAAPDARFDELWQRSRPAYQYVAERSCDFLRWRFLRKPGPGQCQFLALTDRKSRQLAAYAVVEPDQRTAHVRDLFGTSKEDLAALLDRLLLSLRVVGFSSVSLSFLGAPWLVGLLTERGFRPRDHQAVVLDCGKDAPDSPEVLLSPARWYITQADEDG